MHFKAKPWDYERICKTIIDLSRPGLYLFHSFDPYLDVYFSLKLKNLFLENPIAGKLKIVLADEITSDWLDAHLESAELFGNNDSYVVLMAEKLGKPVFAEILKNAVHIKDKFFILFISPKSKKNLYTSVCYLIKMNPIGKKQTSRFFLGSSYFYFR